MFDRELDILTAPDSREAFSEQEELSYAERMALYAEAELDGFFDVDFFQYGFDLGGEA